MLNKSQTVWIPNEEGTEREKSIKHLINRYPPVQRKRYSGLARRKKNGSGGALNVGKKHSYGGLEKQEISSLQGFAICVKW